MAAAQEYEPNATPWVRAQLEKIDRTGDTRSVSMHDRHVVVVIMTGVRTGKARRVPLMRVEHDGAYAAVASKGGAPRDPVWLRNLVANPDVTVQDGTVVFERRARLVEGDERARWWERAVAAYPPYAQYQTRTRRRIPVFVLEPR
ncbi:MAG: nitroreductase family deazaflavin-dependent oxidoreductase [Jatrophihabitans sp.]|nr:MAG: nitroreductase family deazaflavin-dependent oxidoreductase [Jatrophihabitans sp.]